MMDTPDLFDSFAQYPAWPGTKGPAETSALAATAIAPAAVTLRARALDYFREAGASGLTAEELAAAMAVDRVAIQPRVSELRSMGKVVDSGLRRTNASSGKRAVAWCLAEFGEVAESYAA